MWAVRAPLPILVRQLGLGRLDGEDDAGLGDTKRKQGVVGGVALAILMNMKTGMRNETMILMTTLPFLLSYYFSVLL